MTEFKGTPGPWFWTEAKGEAVSLMASGGKWVADPQSEESNYGLSTRRWTDVSRLHYSAGMKYQSSRMEAALKVFDEVVPAGWMVVPCEPTISQMALGSLAGAGLTPGKAADVYQAMTVDYRPA